MKTIITYIKESIINTNLTKNDVYLNPLDEITDDDKEISIEAAAYIKELLTDLNNFCCKKCKTPFMPRDKDYGYDSLCFQTSGESFYAVHHNSNPKEIQLLISRALNYKLTPADGEHHFSLDINIDVCNFYYDVSKRMVEKCEEITDTIMDEEAHIQSLFPDIEVTAAEIVFMRFNNLKYLPLAIACKKYIIEHYKI